MQAAQGLCLGCLEKPPWAPWTPTTHGKVKVLGPMKLVGSHGSQCNWEETTLMSFFLNGTLWNKKTISE